MKAGFVATGRVHNSTESTESVIAQALGTNLEATLKVRFAPILLAATALGFSSSAMAADLIIDTPSYQPGVVDVGSNWDGGYVGVFAGYAGGSLTGDALYDGVDLNGWMLGVTAGADFAVTDGVVFGIAGDIAWNNFEADTVTFSSDWNGSLRGRLGIDGGAFLPYLTAGLAVANGDDGVTDNVHFGWTAGAGVEFAVTEDVSLDLQYRYTDYATADYSGVDIGFNTHAVTFGLNWRF